MMTDPAQMAGNGFLCFYQSIGFNELAALIG